MTLTVCRACAQKLPGRVAPDQEDESPALYQDRQNPYSWKLFGEKYVVIKFKWRVDATERYNVFGYVGMLFIDSKNVSDNSCDT